MKNYVTFECTHFAQTEQSDPDERNALAYADIDGYPEDEGSEGTVICRVWLMKEKDGIYPTYLVDWHHNGYRLNTEVKELIAKAKKDLAEYKDNLIEEVFASAYEKYKMKCMLEDGFTLNILLPKLQAIVEEGRAADVMKALEVFETDMLAKKHQVLWETEDTFREELWENSSYMSELLASNEYALWKSR